MNGHESYDCPSLGACTLNSPPRRTPGFSRTQVYCERRRCGTAFDRKVGHRTRHWSSLDHDLAL